MRLVMAVSADGFVARDEEDDMRWTGAPDKTVFRLLTSVGPEPLAVSLRTLRLMPDTLPGRDLYSLSTTGEGDGTLTTYHHRYPDGWLIGGQTVALQAKRLGLLDEVHVCQSSALLIRGIRLDAALFEGLTARLTTQVMGRHGYVNVTVHR